MRQAITTKYLGPTNHRGARIIARAQAGRRTYHWDHALDVAENHTVAARMFAQEWGWLDRGATLEGGALPDDTGYCFVLCEARSLNGAEILGTRGGVTFVRLPGALHQPHPFGGLYDTLAIPSKGTTYMVHMPDARDARGE